MKDKYNFDERLILRLPRFSIEQSDEEVKAQLLKGPLVLASPSLFKSYLNHDKGIERGIDKYVNRSKFRCTPYGLFAGVGTLSWGVEDKARLNEGDFYTRTRLDASVIDQLMMRILAVPECLNLLEFTLNKTLFKQAEGYQYLEAVYSGLNILYNLSKVETDEFFESVLMLFKQEPTVSATLIKKCLTELDCKEEDVELYISSLIEVNILIPHISSSTLCNDNFVKILDVARKLEDSTFNEDHKILCTLLNELKHKIKSFDQQEEDKNKIFDEVVDLLTRVGIDFKSNQIIQTDTFLKSIEGTVNNDYKKDLVKCIDLLPSSLNRNEDIDDFIKRFYNRYQEEECVPLLKVVDPENGLGFSEVRSSVTNNFLDKIYPEAQQESSEVRLSNFQIQLHEYIKEKKDEINIEHLLAKYKNEDASVLSGISKAALFSVLDEGKIHLAELHGIGAAYLARFAYGHEEVDNVFVNIQELLQKENSEFAIAEIDFLPEARVLNIAARKNVFDYQISICTPTDKTKINIDLRDLYVGVQGNTVLLYAKAIDKFVIPVFTNAYNVSRDTSVLFKFLKNVGEQFFAAGKYFSWGDLAQLYDYLPRVTVGNCIISLRCWKFEGERLKSFITDIKELPYERLYKKFGIPQKLQYVVGDNYLVIDLKSSGDRDILIKEIGKASKVSFSEYLPPKQKFIMNEQGKNFAHEMIAIMNSVNSRKEKSHFTKPVFPSELRRKFIPGSEWVYFKFYCGANSANDFLIKYIYPFVEKHSLIRQWFFIRFADPEHHLRVRFKVALEDQADFQSEVHQLYNLALENSVIWNIKVDTYQRELERYSLEGIDMAEQLFHVNTLMIKDTLVAKVQDHVSDDHVFMFGCLLVHVMLEQSKLNQEELIELSDKMAKGYFEENNISKQLRINIDKKYRDLSAFLQDTLNDPGMLIKEQLVAEQLVLLCQFKDKCVEQKLEKSFENSLTAMIHMACNRLFSDFQRYQEGLIYYFLNKHYRSVKARRKSQVKAL